MACTSWPSRSTATRIRAGFTPVEMLAVISLIVLLISMTLPALQKSKRTARAAICLVNLRQLQIAQRGYSDHNHGRTKNLTHGFGEYWHHSLASYLGDSTYRANSNLGQWKKEPLKVLTCPEANQDPISSPGTAEHVWSWGGGGQGGYGANLWVFPRYEEYDNDFRFQRKHFFPSFTDVDRTSSVPLFGDSNWVGGWPDSVDIMSPDLYNGLFVHEIGYFMGRFTIDRHDRGIQLVFVDSSARRVKLGDLWQLRWHRGYTPVTMATP